VPGAVAATGVLSPHALETAAAMTINERPIHTDAVLFICPR
jgi:hypothetical protein